MNAFFLFSSSLQLSHPLLKMTENKHLVQMNADIENARKKADFSSTSMLHLLRGGPKAIEKLNQVRALAEQEPLFDKSNFPFQSRQEVCVYHPSVV